MDDVLQAAVEQAVHAPSTHNTQPWSFHADSAGGTVRLYGDQSRLLRQVDPDGRELVISCGAALFTLELAIRGFGRQSRVDVLPDPAEPDLIAVVSLGNKRQPSRLEAKLFDAIPNRRTNRRWFYSRHVPKGLVWKMEQAADAEGASFLSIVEKRAEVADLLARADVHQFRDEGFRRELASWLRPNDSRRGDGMPGYSLGFGNLSSKLAGSVLRRVDLGRSQASKSRRLATSSPLLGVIVTDGDEPRDWVHAGRALQRILLEATSEGVSASFLNQAVEVPQLRDQLRGLVGSSGSPQLLLRFGYAPQARPVPRRPLAEVLVA